MYYESYARKKPRPRKKRRGGCLGALLRFFGKLAALALALADGGRRRGCTSCRSRC